MGEGGGAGEAPPVAEASTPNPSAAPEAAANNDSDPAGRVETWLSRLGAGAQRFWRVAAAYAADRPAFTFEDLEAASGISRDTLRNRYRTSDRAIRGAHAPDPMPGRRSPATTHRVYAMLPAVREKILELTAQDVG
jgi:hypothetical protein